MLKKKRKEYNFLQGIFTVKKVTLAFHLGLTSYMCATREVVKGHQYNLKLRLLKSECAESQYTSWVYLVVGCIFY